MTYSHLLEAKSTYFFLLRFSAFGTCVSVRAGQGKNGLVIQAGGQDVVPFRLLTAMTYLYPSSNATEI